MKFGTKLYFLNQSESINESHFKWIANAKSTTAMMPPLYSNAVDVPADRIKVIKVLSTNGDGRSHTFLLVGYELYRLTETTLQQVAVLTDADDPSPNENRMWTVYDIQVHCRLGIEQEASM